MELEAATCPIEHALDYLCELALLKLHLLCLKTKKAYNNLYPNCLGKLAQLCPGITQYFKNSPGLFPM